MKGYKGFNKDLKCCNFAYKIGETYKTETAKLCNSGFHFCENPLHVLRYYNPATSRFAKIEAEDISEETSNDSKRTAKTIKILAELDFKTFLGCAFRFIFESKKFKTRNFSSIFYKWIKI